MLHSILSTRVYYRVVSTKDIIVVTKGIVYYRVVSTKDMVYYRVVSTKDIV